MPARSLTGRSISISGQILIKLYDVTTAPDNASSVFAFFGLEKMGDMLWRGNSKTSYAGLIDVHSKPQR